MNFNLLGKTNLKVSEIGIGTEHLFSQSMNTVKSVVQCALENKINYFDVLFSVQHYLIKLACAFKGYRDQLIITGHIGTTEFEGRVKRNRSVKESKKAFLRILSILQTNYVDILNIQYVTAKEYDKVINPGGLFELATSFKEDGKARFLSLSTHDILVATQAIKSGNFDMIMFPINLANHGLKCREELLKLCLKSKIGLVAIKPFAGGKLLDKNRTIYFAKHQTGGLTFKKKIPSDITPSHCINYVNSIPEVSLVLIGVKNIYEINENLSYLTIKACEMDYSSYIRIFQ
ncbi:MAG: aldo/keto reductase [Candidatus Hodarchaeota archaeon]